MGVDRSQEFKMDFLETEKGKPNAICPHCKKTIPYNGRNTNCPYCGYRYPKYTIRNSAGVQREVN